MPQVRNHAGFLGRSRRTRQIVLLTSRLVELLLQHAKVLPPLKLCVMQTDDHPGYIDARCDTSNDFTDLKTARIPFLRFKRSEGVSVIIPNNLWSCAREIFDRLSLLLSDIHGNAQPMYADFMQHLRRTQLETLLDNLLYFEMRT
jgi:hypothetical protein